MHSKKLLQFPLVFCSLLFASAAFPQETGPDDFRITNIGPAGDVAFFAARPVMAYNSTDDEYLTVFSSAGGAGLAAGEIELWSQRIGPDGTILGNPVRVTEVGGTNVVNVAASRYELAYNSTLNEYLLVWQVQDPVFSDVRPNIYARRIANTGAPVAAAFAVSQTTGAGAFWPQVAFNATDNEYLVVWTDNDSGVFLATGQIMGGTGTVVRDDFIVSKQTTTFSDRPAAGWDSVNNQYLVAWTNSVALFGNVLDADGDYQVDPDFRISENSQGTNGASIAFDPVNEEYLVAFGDSVNGVSSTESSEIYTRRVSAAGLPQGSVKRASFSAGDGADGTGANIDMFSMVNQGQRPGVAYNATAKAFVVTWDGSVVLDNVGQREIFIRVMAGGQEPSGLQAQNRISEMGGRMDGGAFVGFHPVIASQAGSRKLLVVWWGDDNRSGGVDNEIELYGQFLDLDFIFNDGFE